MKEIASAPCALRSHQHSVAPQRTPSPWFPCPNLPPPHNPLLHKVSPTDIPVLSQFNKNAFYQCSFDNCFASYTCLFIGSVPVSVAVVNGSGPTFPPPPVITTSATAVVIPPTLPPPLPARETNPWAKVPTAPPAPAHPGKSAYLDIRVVVVVAYTLFYTYLCYLSIYKQYDKMKSYSIQHPDVWCINMPPSSGLKKVKRLKTTYSIFYYLFIYFYFLE